MCRSRHRSWTLPESSRPKSVALSRKQDPSKKLEEEARKKAAKAGEVWINSGSRKDRELLGSTMSGDTFCQAQQLPTAQDSPKDGNPAINLLLQRDPPSLHFCNPAASESQTLSSEAGEAISSNLRRIPDPNQGSAYKFKNRAKI